MIGIQVVAWPGHLSAAPGTAWFDTPGGDIGRSADCTLPLPDPERHISRRHARVVERQGCFYVQPLSTGMPLTLDGAALPVGDEVLLSAGMRLGLGDYVLQVLDEPESVGSPPTRVPDVGPAVDLLVGETGDAVAAASPTKVAPVPAAAAPWAAGDVGAALLHGLGMATAVGGVFDAERAQRVGALLRAMTQGTLELLTARMVAKRELGAAATQLRTRENNPLKFSPDVETALTHLLGPAERGFLDHQTAVQEAFDDLRAHQVALLAGMRAALDSVMSRFDPAALEKRLAPGSALENLIPANRRARLWSAYGDEYARIVGEIEDDFDALLGRAFLKAYQAQLEALAPDRKPGPPQT